MIYFYIAFIFYLCYNLTMKAMGIDFGMSRIGIAFSDETKFLASPYSTYKRVAEESDLAYFINLIKNQKVDEIVCGLPMNMQGEEQEIAQLTRQFMSKIEEQTNIKVQFVDERLSSVLAEEYLAEREKDWRKRKEKLDAVAASIILQDYLDKRRK